MNINIRRIILRRFGEFMFLEVVLSVMITVFSMAGVLSSRNLVLHSTVLCVILYVLVNIKRLRRCFYELENPPAYFFSNLVAYVTFAVINVTAYLLCSNEVFTWLFAVTKFARYAHVGFSTVTSIEAFHIIMVIAIIFAPAGIKER